MKPGRITRDRYLFRDYADGDDDDDESKDDDDGEDEHGVLKLDNRGFVFTAVHYDDEDTYKCEARKQNQQEIMYFYMHVGKYIVFWVIPLSLETLLQ
jgi:hypothetical protein